MDDRLREALGFPRPPRALVRAVEGGLRGRGRAVACCRRDAGRSCARSFVTVRTRPGTGSKRSDHRHPTRRRPEHGCRRARVAGARWARRQDRSPVPRFPHAVQEHLLRLQRTAGQVSRHTALRRTERTDTRPAAKVRARLDGNRPVGNRSRRGRMRGRHDRRPATARPPLREHLAAWPIHVCVPASRPDVPEPQRPRLLLSRSAWRVF